MKTYTVGPWTGPDRDGCWERCLLDYDKPGEGADGKWRIVCYDPRLPALVFHDLLDLYYIRSHYGVEPVLSAFTLEQCLLYGDKLLQQNPYLRFPETEEKMNYFPIVIQLSEKKDKFLLINSPEELPSGEAFVIYVTKASTEICAAMNQAWNIGWNQGYSEGLTAGYNKAKDPLHDH